MFVALKKQRFERVELFRVELDKKRYSITQIII